MRNNENSALSIKRALIEALEQGNRSMSVSQLCRLSGVARATFYLHFKAIDDVFIAIIDDIFSDLEDFRNSSAKLGRSDSLKQHMSSRIQATFKHRSTLLALIDLGLLDSITRRARDTVRRSLFVANPSLEDYAGTDGFEDSLSFVVGGCGLLMETWLRSSSKSTADPRLVDQLVEMFDASLKAGIPEGDLT